MILYTPNFMSLLKQYKLSLWISMYFIKLSSCEVDNFDELLIISENFMFIHKNT